MRKLPFLPILLLLALLPLAAAASAHAPSLPVAGQPALLSSPADGEGGDNEGEADDEGGEAEEGDEGEGCSAEEDEEGEEESCEEGADAEAEECLLEEADSSVVVVPGHDLVRLSVHYRAFEPTAVNVDFRLHSSKGGLHLGIERARFHRGGVYRDSFSLSPQQMPKTLAAAEFTIDLRPVGAPAACELQLATRGSRRAK